MKWLILIVVIFNFGKASVPLRVGADLEKVGCRIPEGELKSHRAIKIRSNGSFTSAQGVTEGEGTKENPFIIQGWKFTESDGISIGRTNVYFVIRDCVLKVRKRGKRGIELFDLSNARVEYVTIESASSSVYLARCKDCEIKNNRVLNNGSATIEMHDIDGIIVENNLVTSRGKDGICINGVTGRGVQVVYNTGADVRLEAIEVFRVGAPKLGEGMVIHGKRTYCWVAFNHCYGCGQYGIEVAGGGFAEEVVIEGNLLEKNGVGIHVYGGGKNILFIGNTLKENKREGTFLNGSGHLLYHNNFIDNRASPQGRDRGENNKWYNPETRRGNFWSDLSGEDKDGDGVIDGKTYRVRDGGEDRYPLVERVEVLMIEKKERKR